MQVDRNPPASTAAPASRTPLFLAATLLVCVLPLKVGCSENEGERLGEPTERTVYSSKDFDQGRADGERDAKQSWFDDSGEWMWGWMVSKDYLKGYQQGWIAGRTQVNFQAEQQRLKGENEALQR